MINGLTHRRNVEFQIVPDGQAQTPPVQLLPPIQKLLVQISPAPAADRQVLVLTGF